MPRSKFAPSDESKREFLSLRVRPDIRARLYQAAKAQNRTMSNLAEALLDAGLPADPGGATEAPATGRARGGEGKAAQ